MLGCLGSHRVPRIQIRLTCTRVLLLSAIRFKSSCMDVICYLAIHQHPSADILRAAHFSPLQKALFRQQKAPRWSPCAWSCHTQRGSNAHSAPLDQMERGSGVFFSSMDWSKLNGSSSLQGSARLSLEENRSTQKMNTKSSSARSHNCGALFVVLEHCASQRECSAVDSYWLLR